jgi:hypothetical protein
MKLPPDPHNVKLRAERAGAGTGRIYTIAIFEIRFG